MSTTTPPAAPAPAPADASAEEVTPQGDPAADEPLGEPGKKALQAERTARAQAEQAQAALQKQLDEIEASKLSDIERAQREATAAKEEAAKAQAEVLRFRIAAESGIKENIDLILTGPDEATMRAQADLWSKRTPGTTNPKPDLSQGGKPTQSEGDSEMRELVRGLFSKSD